LKIALSFAAHQVFGVGYMLSLDMHGLAHWFTTNENAIAVLITVGVAIFLVCCLECTNCSCREKDDLFRRQS
jgi:hypothetical protein